MLDVTLRSRTIASANVSKNIYRIILRSSSTYLAVTRLNYAARFFRRVTWDSYPTLRREGERSNHLPIKKKTITATISFFLAYLFRFSRFSTYVVFIAQRKARSVRHVRWICECTSLRVCVCVCVCMCICIVFTLARVLVEMKERNATWKRFPLDTRAPPVCSFPLRCIPGRAAPLTLSSRIKSYHVIHST